MCWSNGAPEDEDAWRLPKALAPTVDDCDQPPDLSQTAMGPGRVLASRSLPILPDLSKLVSFCSHMSPLLAGASASCQEGVASLHTRSWAASALEEMYFPCQMPPSAGRGVLLSWGP